MNFTSPTRQKEWIRCPKRYFYRYLYVPPNQVAQEEHLKRRLLYSIRELAGHLIHRTLAEMINSLAEGNGLGNLTQAGKSCLEQFMDIVAHSCAVEPGVFLGGLQLTETFNGPPDESFGEQIKFWRDSIPTLIENGGRVALTVGMKQRSADYSLRTEQEVSLNLGTQTYRLIIDVITQSRYQTTVVDWKTHEIDNQDVNQVRLYLRYLHQHEKVPISQLFGFAVNLFKEEIVRVVYNPYATSKPRSATIELDRQAAKESFAPRPHPFGCRRCAYLSLCPVAAT